MITLSTCSSLICSWVTEAGSQLDQNWAEVRVKKPSAAAPSAGRAGALQPPLALLLLRRTDVYTPDEDDLDL